MKRYKAIGLMSGTSLDGLDVAACEFIRDEKGKWSYDIKHCHTYPYLREWKDRLKALPGLSALDFATAHAEYGHYLGRLTRAFIEHTGFVPDIIASHGHTIFHQPEKGLTVQIGSGAALAAETGYTVVCDFRTLDVALGGQGAPLVPAGDQLLFHEYDACLNLGGFANVSFDVNRKRIAFDICPVNIVLNLLSGRLGEDFDKDGQMAAEGSVVPSLLEKLNALPYYLLPYPKSLGREWLESDFIRILDNSGTGSKDLLRTVCEHIAIQIKSAIPSETSMKVLVTGGGSHNGFLMDRIRHNSAHEWIIPSDEIPDFKEALVFAFLGVLRLEEEINVLASVTGSKKDHSGGALYHLPKD